MDFLRPSGSFSMNGWLDWSVVEVLSVTLVSMRGFFFFFLLIFKVETEWIGDEEMPFFM